MILSIRHFYPRQLKCGNFGHNLTFLPHEVQFTSRLPPTEHRNRLAKLATEAKNKGVRVLITGNGHSAHLAGVTVAQILKEKTLA